MVLSIIAAHTITAICALCRVLGCILVAFKGTQALQRTLVQAGRKRREVYDPEAAIMVNDNSARDGVAASRQLPGEWRPLGALLPMRSAPPRMQTAAQALDRGTALTGAHHHSRACHEP